MSRGTERPAALANRTAPAPREGDREPAELDLDRLVWDPEYRAAMRPFIERER